VFDIVQHGNIVVTLQKIVISRITSRITTREVMIREEITTACDKMRNI